ncbi:uncharacterized protein B0H64DRAFT_392699 [Chaetomium fimeti]|uniref:Elongation factor 3 four helical bundle domain-containing protein n=1 Tax=Chaetomium fimeti TaxID=1854472 RepID=A0AAE0LU58_9PEZI|nr:hypothetical protein B0H64DRAFT_392699 [Chaetomium fimeti]
MFINEKATDAASGAESVKPYITVVVGDSEGDGVVDALRKRAIPGTADADAVDDDGEEEDKGRCNCTFSTSLSPMAPKYS